MRVVLIGVLGIVIVLICSCEMGFLSSHKNEELPDISIIGDWLNDTPPEAVFISVWGFQKDGTFEFWNVMKTSNLSVYLTGTY
jgi:hypothetical protein